MAAPAAGGAVRAADRAAKRYERELGLTPYDAGVLRSTKALGDLFEQALGAAKKADAKQVSNG